MSRVRTSVSGRIAAAVLVLGLMASSHAGAARAGDPSAGPTHSAAAAASRPLGLQEGDRPDAALTTLTASSSLQTDRAAQRTLHRGTSPSRPAAPSVPARSLLVHLVPGLAVTSGPGGGRLIGTMPTRSKYYGVPLVAWIMHVSANGRFGQVAVPYSPTHASGWIRLRGLRGASTNVYVKVSLSKHRLSVYRNGRLGYTFTAGTGAPWSPTPPGDYFVTDRVPFPSGSALGWFAFGISGIQTHPPPGWHGGDQLAIHGTNAPWTIGISHSAGCVHVSSDALSKLLPLLQLGTPVVIVR